MFGWTHNEGWSESISCQNNERPFVVRRIHISAFTSAGHRQKSWMLRLPLGLNHLPQILIHLLEQAAGPSCLYSTQERCSINGLRLSRVTKINPAFRSVRCCCRQPRSVYLDILAGLTRPSSELHTQLLSWETTCSLRVARILWDIIRTDKGKVNCKVRNANPTFF
jgi:hypothetical protein